MKEGMSTAKRLMALFGGGRANAYDPATLVKDANGKTTPKKIYTWRDKPPTAELWEQHLNGVIGLGIIAPQPDGKVLFGSIDVDVYDDFDVHRSEVVSQVYADKMPLIPTETKSGGLHLFLFAAEPVDPNVMVRALRNLAGQLKLPLKEAGGKTEIIVTANLWMPYVGGNRFPAVKTGGLNASVVEFCYVAEDARLSLDTIAKLAATSTKAADKAAPSATDGARYADRRLGHYCSKLAETADGEGRNALLNKALHQMGRLVGAGWIERERVERELKQVADSIGMDRKKTEDLIGRRGGKGPLGKGMLEPPPNINEVKPSGFVPIMVRVADVPPQEVVWLWKGRIARGKLTIIGGHPGISKSTVTIDMAARVTVGGPWPCGEGTAPKGSVVFITSEDDVGDTIHPRLAAAGADVSQVHVLKGMAQGNGDGRRGFDLTTDIAALEDAVRKIGDVVMIIIDPVTAYMGKPGKVDSYRVTDVRAMFEPLQDMAANCGAAVIGINHLSKGGSAEALMRFLGSVGMVATSRASYLIVRDKENADRRLFLPAKNNIGDDRTGFAFKVSLKATGYDKPPSAIAVDWESETVSITADEALAADAKETDGRKSEGAETAKKLIVEMLRNGPRAAIEFEQRARELSISPSSMRTAKRALSVMTAKKGKGGWEWYFPGQAQSELPMGTEKEDDL